MVYTNAIVIMENDKPCPDGLRYGDGKSKIITIGRLNWLLRLRGEKRKN